MHCNRQEILKTLPVATIFLMIAIIWPKLIHSSPHMGHNWDDVLRGVVFGLAIGMLLMMGINMRGQRRGGHSREATKTANTPSSPWCKS